MTRKYFGTDGIRGRVGQAPITPEFALKLGWAAGCVLAKTTGARVLIGKDTRRSGYMMESALEAGFAAAGVEADLLGPLPTPGVAYLTRALRAQAGVMISASHNPHEDNGVKFFGADGEKLPDALEAQIEKMLDAEMCCVESIQLGRARRIEDAQGRYIEFCKSTFPSTLNLRGMNLVVDCANGAAYKTAPAVLAELGATVHAIGIEPNGLNINLDCGSTHLDLLKRTVVQRKADLGIALDGDADRCLMVTAEGQTVDGDEILYLIARNRKQHGTLRGPVVGTLMSNLGLEQALEKLGLDFERANVGDRYVLERLKARDGTLGGETSGHTLCLDRTTSGDGTVTALQVLAALLESKATIAKALKGMHKHPQVLVNVRVSSNAKALLENTSVRKSESVIVKKLAGRGRVLLRASGTEPLIRVMVEADDMKLAQQSAATIADAVRRVTK
ncbi:MAG: phosphoglucosamine mutase [Pseudomonadota bacterium]